jgi:hypothetical protein
MPSIKTRKYVADYYPSYIKPLDVRKVKNILKSIELMKFTDHSIRKGYYTLKAELRNYTCLRNLYLSQQSLAELREKSFSAYLEIRGSSDYTCSMMDELYISRMHIENLCKIYECYCNPELRRKIEATVRDCKSLSRKPVKPHSFKLES